MSGIPDSLAFTDRWGLNKGSGWKWDAVGMAVFMMYESSNNCAVRIRDACNRTCVQSIAWSTFRDWLVNDGQDISM